MAIHQQNPEKFKMSYDTNKLILQFLTQGGTIQVCKAKKPRKQITANGKNKGAISSYNPVF